MAKQPLYPHKPRGGHSRAPIVRFALGKLVMTRGVSDKVAEDTAFAKFVMDSLRRHATCDWGDLDPEDNRANTLAVNSGNLRILSAYTLAAMPKIWIITEADRSSTTILYPEEY